MQIKPGMEGDDKSRPELTGFRKKQKHSLEGGGSVGCTYWYILVGRRNGNLKKKVISRMPKDLT